MRHFNYFLALIFISCITLQLNAQAPQLAATPPMGYNSYDSYNNSLTQETAIKLMDVMAEKYKPFGYEYFVIDLGWYTEHELIPGTSLPVEKKGKNKFHLDKNGLPEPSVSLYSGGIKALADHAHAKGLKFGLHLMRGVIKQAITEGCKVKGTDILIKDIVDTLSVCVWFKPTYGVDTRKPGAQEYYNSLMQKMADWGVDFIKYDDITGMPNEILAITNGIAKTGRPIVLSLSPGEDTKLQFMPYYQKCNMLRITKDIWDTQHAIDKGFEAMKAYQGMGIPGFWPDLDMLALGPLEVLKTNKSENKGMALNSDRNMSRMSRFNQEQAKTFITQRAIFASPLIMGGDMLTMDAFHYGIITNKDMIACNQNGVTAVLASSADSVEIYHAINKTNPRKGWVAVFNLTATGKTKNFSKNDFGFTYKRPVLNVLMPNYSLRDIWNPTTYTLNSEVELTIPANGVVFFEYTEKE